jgi:cytochrome c peroxidase
MGRHTASRIRRTLAAGASVLILAPALVFSQGPPPGVNPGVQDPAITPSPTRTVVIVRSDGRGLRKLAELTMPVPADNPLTEDKAALGRRLFFDPVLSNDRSVSCATCHDPARAFADGRTLAVGVFGRVGKRHSPSLVNRGFGRTHFWDGRAATLEAQVLQPIVDPNEMDLSLEEAAKRLNDHESYRAAFQSVFGRPISQEDLGRALATYLRTIRSGDAPYDRFIAGDPDGLSSEQQLGLRIFRTKGRCFICHFEPLFSDENFHSTGVAWRIESGSATGSYQDDGRFLVSSRELDRERFKTPTLREIARTAPYMHDGSQATLADVVDFYDRGGRPNPNLFPAIGPLNLSAEEKQALIAFLEALSGVVTGQ